MSWRLCERKIHRTIGWSEWAAAHRSVVTFECAREDIEAGAVILKEAPHLAAIAAFHAQQQAGTKAAKPPLERLKRLERFPARRQAL